MQTQTNNAMTIHGAYTNITRASRNIIRRRQLFVPDEHIEAPARGVDTETGAYCPRRARLANCTASSAARNNARALFTHSCCSEAGSES